MEDVALALVCFAAQFAAGMCIFFRVWRCITPLHDALVRHAERQNQAFLTVQLNPTTTTETEAGDDHRLQPVLTRTRGDLNALNAYRKMLLADSVFLSHVRLEDNFKKDNTAEGLVLPPACPSERAQLLTAPLTLTVLVLRNRGSRNMIWNAVGFALMMSSLAPLVWLAEMQGADAVVVGVLGMVRSKIGLARGGFTFLVAFMLLGLLNFVVARWREYLAVLQTVKAKVQDLGVAVGAAVIDGADADTRRRLFRIYRYLNVVHAMTYASVEAQLPQSAEGFGVLGLLNAAEIAVLAPLARPGSKSLAEQREAVVGWVGGLLGAMVRDAKLHGPFSPPSQGMVNGLRAACAQYDNLAVRHMPNLWIACTHTLMVFLFALVDLQIVFDLSASELDASPRGMLLCACVSTFVASAVVNYVYMLAWAMIEELSSPFGADSDDDYNPGALLGAAERSLFASLRTSFDRAFLDAGLSGKSEGVSTRV